MAQPQDNDKIETREEKFLRLAEARMTRALNELRLVKNCFSANYSFRPEWAKLMIQQLRSGVDDVEQQAFKPKGKQVLKFSWEDRANAH